MKVTCLLKDFDVSESGRIYNKEAMEAAVKEYMSKPDYQRLGEIEPKDNEIHVNLSDVSHKIENMKFMGNKLYCEIELLNTPGGKVAQNMINSSIDLNLAPRMIGQPVYKLDEDGKPTNEIIGYDNLNIISVDIVKE